MNLPILKTDPNYEKSKKFCLASSQDIAEIASPLLSYLGASGGFSYQRIYKNDQRLWLSTSEKWIESFYDNEYFLTMGYERFCHIDMMLWKHWPKKDKNFINLISNANVNFNYDNGFLINIKRDDYIDSFGFRGNLGDDDINRRYLNNIHIIKKFLHLFLIKSEKLITAASNYRFDVPKTPSANLFKNKSLSNFQELCSSNMEIFKKEELFIDDHGDPFTHRLSECIYLIILGNTSKEIAKKLKISPRTVEDYIECIKMRLGITSKSQIIERICSNKKNLALVSEYFLFKANE